MCDTHARYEGTACRAHGALLQVDDSGFEVFFEGFGEAAEGAVGHEDDVVGFLQFGDDVLGKRFNLSFKRQLVAKWG